MMKLSTWRQPILSILVYTIVFSLIAYFWKETGDKSSSIAIFISGATGALISSIIIRFMNRKQNKVLNDLQ